MGGWVGARRAVSVRVGALASERTRQVKRHGGDADACGGAPRESDRGGAYEFFTSQKFRPVVASVPKPTSSTAWSVLVPQPEPLMTPLA